VTEPAAVNLASVYGWGFPGYTGGVLQYLETYGVEEFIGRCAELEERYGPRFSVPRYVKNYAPYEREYGVPR
jgi:3-hydroxyacyl-CoA dehydrogenase/enoyl-CoA hydratase/3-hydroxybutyryl-CoA epimerase